MFAIRRFTLKMVHETGKNSTKSINSFSTTAQIVPDDSKSSNAAARFSYEDAISKLNSLQTNSNTIKESVIRTHNITCPHIQETKKYLERTGVTLEQLDTLSVIHVSGTKGKGSTCAMVESILRNFNVKTGFFSSPHLVLVNERIRLNGQPISQHLFTEHFWKVFNKLELSREHANDMPPYFKFLTIMAYNVFLHEKVDVAIVEVGIGGEYDCTNIIRNTKTVGITSLGLEHTQLLGKTIDNIAWQKSGIIKPNSSVFTVTQPDGCDAVMKSRAAEKNAQLSYVPALSDYKYKAPSQLQEIIENPARKLNASLAIQLSYDWIRRNPDLISNKELLQNLIGKDAGLTLSDEVVAGLLNCIWPGRCQILQYGNKRLYIDGAHTTESLKICTEWFVETTKNSKSRKMLMFNVTGERNSNDLLDILHENLRFDLALFTPNISSFSSNANDNIYTFAQPDRSVEHSEYWNSLSTSNGTTKTPNISETFPCIADLFSFLDNNYGNEEIEILITGSLHLVGEVIRTIQN